MSVKVLQAGINCNHHKSLINQGESTIQYLLNDSQNYLYTITDSLNILTGNKNIMVKVSMSDYCIYIKSVLILKAIQRMLPRSIFTYLIP
jgi:hypothetical protein